MANKADQLASTSAERFYKEPMAATGPQGPITVKFGTNAANLEMAKCYPVGFNATTELYAPWMAPDPTVVVLNEDGAITIDGQATATIDVSAATEATVKGELLALGISASVSEATDVFTVTLDGDAQVSVVPTVTVSGASNTVTDGTSTYGTHKFQGFVFPNDATLDDTDTVQAAIALDGQIHIDEMTDLVDSGDVAALTAEVKKRGLIAIKVEGVPNIHKGEM